MIAIKNVVDPVKRAKLDRRPIDVRAGGEGKGKTPTRLPMGIIKILIEQAIRIRLVGDIKISPHDQGAVNRLNLPGQLLNVLLGDGRRGMNIKKGHRSIRGLYPGLLQAPGFITLAQGRQRIAANYSLRKGARMTTFINPLKVELPFRIDLA